MDDFFHLQTSISLFTDILQVKSKVKNNLRTSKILLTRFIYVCYASGLLKEGVSLLHWIVMIVLTFMCINSTIIYPIRFVNYLLPTYVKELKFEHWINFFRHILSGEQYQDTLKGIICTKTNISYIIKDENAKTEISDKPFLMAIVGATTFLGLIYFYFFTALGHRFFKSH